MASDKLYELAFEYKKTKLWKKLYDTDIFAVKLSDGEIGYISIMGIAGEHFALAVYVGDKAFASLNNMMKEEPHYALSKFEMNERLLQQDCLQCAFENKDMLSEEEHEEAKKYVRSHGIKLGGSNAYPQFVRYKPNCYPWFLQDTKEEEYLCEALSAAIEVSRLIGKKRDIPHYEFYDVNSEIVLFEKKDGEYVMGNIKLPVIAEKKFIEPVYRDVFAVEKLKRQKKQGIWECEVIRFPEPMQNAPDEVPVFPVILLAVESESGFILPPVPVSDYEENAKMLLDYLAESFVKQGVYPREIRVRDARTFFLLTSFCKKLGIRLSKNEDLFALQDAEDQLWHNFRGEPVEWETIDDMIELLVTLDDSQLKEMPHYIVNNFKALYESGFLPEELEDKLSNVFGFGK